MTKLFRLLFLSIILLVVSSCEDSNEKSQSQIEFEQRQKNHFKKYAKNELLKSPKFLEIQNKFESDNNFKIIKARKLPVFALIAYEISTNIATNCSPLVIERMSKYSPNTDENCDLSEKIYNATKPVFDKIIESESVLNDLFYFNYISDSFVTENSERHTAGFFSTMIECEKFHKIFYDKKKYLLADCKNFLDEFLIAKNKHKQLITKIKLNQTEKIKYKIVSEETLEEVCRKGFGCSNTIKRIISSNDDFLFETYLTDSKDSVGCTPNPYDKDEIKDTPCSTVGDFGAGRHFMKITSIKTKKTIKIEAPHVVTRVNTLLDNPNIIFRTSTGGASCCTEYLTYSKNTLELISSKNSLE